MQYLGFVLILVVASGSVACGGAPTEPKSGEDASQSASTFAAQVAGGATLYAAHCSSCHGKGGEGTANGPAVVGPTALPLDPPSGARVRKSRFVTVADVAAFVVKNMPADKPGSLSSDEYFEVLAFDLKANGIDLGDQKLVAALAETLTIPRN